MIGLTNKPENVNCPVCSAEYEFYLDAEGDWDIDSQWWATPEIPFLDSRHCWLKASGYRFDTTQGRWVK